MARQRPNDSSAKSTRTCWTGCSDGCLISHVPLKNGRKRSRRVFPRRGNSASIEGHSQQRGTKGLPLERVYRHLFDPELFLRGYGRIYRNDGAMTRGITKETVDSMCLGKI